MAKGFGKFLFYTAMTGAAAYGVYSYLQNNQKSKQVVDVPADEADDDFDDFSEDLDDELPPKEEHSYVSVNLDKAERVASEAFQKAKEAIVDSEAYKKAKDVITDPDTYKKAKEVISEGVSQVKETVKSVTEPAHTNFTDLSEAAKDVSEEVEEFFDDEDDDTL